MKARFVHDGNRIDYTPTEDVAAGDVVVQDDLVGVAKIDIPAGRTGSLALVGVYDVEKSTAAFDAGQKVYWSTTTSQAVSTESGNTYMGKAVKAALADDETVRVRLEQ